MFLTLRRSMRGPIALSFSGRRSCHTFGGSMTWSSTGMMRGICGAMAPGYMGPSDTGPSGQYGVGRRDRRDERQRVVDDSLCVVGRDARDRVTRQHDLIATIHGVEREIRHADVHGHTHADDRRRTEVPQDRIELWTGH